MIATPSPFGEGRGEGLAKQRITPDPFLFAIPTLRALTLALSQRERESRLLTDKFLAHSSKISPALHKLKSMLLGAFHVAPLGGIDPNAIAFVNEGRDLDRHAIFERCRLVDIGNRGAFERRLGLCN